MTYRNCQVVLCRLLSGVAFLIICMGGVCQTTGSQVKLHLQESDSKVLAASGDNYRMAEFIMKVPASRLDPDQGWTIEDVKVVFGRDFTALVSKKTYLGPPKYKPLSGLYREYDYDENGNLIVWRSAKVVCVCTAERNDRLEFSDRYTVNQAGDIISTGSNIQLSLYPQGDLDQSIPEFRNFLLAVGHGFARELAGDARDTQTLTKDGGFKADAKARFAGAEYGNWRLEGEALRDNLVRKGVLRSDDNRVILEVETTGTIRGEDDNYYAATGVVKNHFLKGPSGSYDISIERLLSVRTLSSASPLVASILTELDSPLPPDRTEILDARQQERTLRTLTESKRARELR